MARRSPELTAGIPDLQVEIDRQEWSAFRRFRTFGVHIGVRATEARHLERLDEWLPPIWEPYESGPLDVQYSFAAHGESVLLYRDQAKVVQAIGLRRALARLELDFHKRIGQHSPNRLFVHAGAVAWKGCAVVAPGRTRLGKTSLVRALVEAGATYYSDDWAVFDERGWLVPYPKRLSIRQPGGGMTRRRVEELGGVAATEPLPLGMVVMTKFREGASWRPRENSRAQAMMALWERAIVARNRPDFALPILEKAVKSAAVLKGPRGEASEVARALLDFAETRFP